MALLRSKTSVRTLMTLLSLLAVASAAAVVFMAPGADAEPAHGTHIKYYNNASHSVQVGYRYYDCAGVLQSSWGVTSPYSSSATYGCIEW